MTADELGITGIALQAALDFEAAFPNETFTSGTRDLAEQAHAMATNVMANRQWILLTYIASDASEACQMAVDKSDAETVDDMASLLLGVLSQFSADQLKHLSAHLSRQAFDVKPSTNMNALAWLRARAMAVGGRFLDIEGGLTRWHWQAYA